jgi:hypothetical protein
MSSDEPHITINGRELTTGQALAVRVAITSFHAEMSESNALGDDEHGRFMTEHYRDRLSEVLRLVLVGEQRNG